MVKVRSAVVDRRRLSRAAVLLGLLTVLGAATWLSLNQWIGSRQAQAEVHQTQRRWAQDTPGRSLELGLAEPPSPVAAQDGETMALLRISRLGDSWVTPVKQGVGTQVLRSATGHYPGTAGPGERGNFSVAGHRTTWAHPFRDLDELEVGDLITVETENAHLVYRVRRSAVVSPSDLSILEPTQPWSEWSEQRILTLTTCHPEFSNRERLVVQAVYDAELSGIWVQDVARG